jgi:hypothetical protein
MQHINDRSEPLEQLGIALPEFVKRLCLFLEYDKDRLGVVTAIDLRGERVIAEIFPSSLCVFRQGGIKDYLKVRGSGGCIRS